MSVALASFVFLLAAVCAWAVVWFGRRADEPEGKLRALAVMFLGLGVVGGVFVYRTDREMRRETLFETVLPSVNYIASPTTTTLTHRFGGCRGTESPTKWGVAPGYAGLSREAARASFAGPGPKAPAPPEGGDDATSFELPPWSI